MYMIGNEIFTYLASARRPDKDVWSVADRAMIERTPSAYRKLLECRLQLYRELLQLHCQLDCVAFVGFNEVRAKSVNFNRYEGLP